MLLIRCWASYVQILAAQVYTSAMTKTNKQATEKTQKSAATLGGRGCRIGGGAGTGIQMAASTHLRLEPLRGVTNLSARLQAAQVLPGIGASRRR